MNRYRKAIFAAVSTLLSSLILVLPDGVTPTEGLGVALAVVGVVGGVYGLSNEPAPA